MHGNSVQLKSIVLKGINVMVRQLCMWSVIILLQVKHVGLTHLNIWLSGQDEGYVGIYGGCKVKKLAWLILIKYIAAANIYNDISELEGLK